MKNAVLEKTLQQAKYETVRVFGGKPGNYWTAEGYRKYAYRKAGTPGTCSLGKINDKTIPRMYFSKPVVRNNDLPFNVTERYDYEIWFPLGTGPMACDEDNRIIQTWSPLMEDMSATIWNEMQNDKRFSGICKKGNEFNHCSIHLYRAGANITKHEDRRRNGRNSMKEKTAVAVFTLGDNRLLGFHRRYPDSDGKLFTESDPCYVFNQCEGCLFILHPDDEVLKGRRDHGGKRREEATFVHGITCPKREDYLSIAFVFRCLDDSALSKVNSATDRVIPPPPKTVADKKRRMERAAFRKEDNKPNSEFKKQVKIVQAEWISLLEKKNWL